MALMLAAAAPATPAAWADASPPSGATPRASLPWPVQPRASAAEQDEQSASPAAPEQRRLAELVTLAWGEAMATWQQVLGPMGWQDTPPHLNFVETVTASHCYGLYVSAGPVYCSGNHTVFISAAELVRLEKKLPDMGDAGIALLVAHELGHHVQKLSGRARILSGLMRTNPQLQRELSVRYELEADCLAGVWAGNTPAIAAAEPRRQALLGALDAIGDDRIMLAQTGRLEPEAFTHGTSSQRRRWFEAGYQARNIAVCNVLEAAQY